ncbi:MAG: hypothetical protein RL173_2123 [Fibrobacterota bacterium]|jgi:hypothetical protein
MNIRWLVAVLASGLLQSCDLMDSKTAKNDHSGTNDETSSFVLPDGQKASNATVTVFAVGSVDSLPQTVAYTNRDGKVELKDLPRGYYSLLVTDKSGSASFVDSVYSDGAKVNVPSDTLRPTGSIKGKIKVQPQDDPKIAWVALVGTGFFRTIDNDSGTFLLTGVPAGSHTLVSRTDRSEYTSTFKTALVRPDSVTDVGSIELVYTGLPIVTGIVGTWDSLGGIVELEWDASTSPIVKGYRVYRGTSRNSFDETYLGTVDSGTTRFVDTAFPVAKIGVASKGLFVDTSYVRYFVRVVGQKGEEGDRWNSWSATLRSPLMVAQLPASWIKVTSTAPVGMVRLDTLEGSLVGFGQDSVGRNAVWKSVDGGNSWSLLLSRFASQNSDMGLVNAVSHGGSLRWVDGVVSGRKAVFPSPLIAQDLLDSLRIFTMDASGRVDSNTIAAAGDTIQQALLLVDSVGLVLVEGDRNLNLFTYSTFFTPTHRLLEGPGGEWILGSWASWFKPFWDDSRMFLKIPVRTVSVTGRWSVLPYGSIGSHLDLDSLALGVGGILSYSRPTATGVPHKVQGGPDNLTSIAWFKEKIYVLGNGSLWNVALP